VFIFLPSLPPALLPQSRDDLTIRIDRHTSVTGVTKKNYSTDPSKSIVLEAFALEKAVGREGGREGRREGEHVGLSRLFKMRSK